MDEHGPNVAVCICTHRRPVQLRRLLESLHTLSCPPSTGFVIVDNDGGDPAIEGSVSSFRSASGHRVEFAIEHTPGIAAARNRALTIARTMGAELVAMLDDDEWPSKDWLAHLIATRARSGAAVVGGPVEPVFSPGCEPREEYKPLWSIGAAKRNGKTIVSSTSNCLIDLSALEPGEAAFDPRFAFTGGEDTVLFRRLFFAGTPMAWAPEAVVFEEVPKERATIAWMRRRWFRLGNVGLACERAARDPSGLPPFVKSILLCFRLPLYPLLNRNVPATPLLWLLELERIRGRIARHFGLVVEQYAQ